MAALLMFLCSSGVVLAELPDAPPAPRISAVDQAYLVKVARRAIEASWRGGPQYAPPFVPETLQSLFCQASVTLRRHGRLEAVGASVRRQAVEACLEAARTAALDPRQGAAAKPEALTSCTLSIELMGEPQGLGTVLVDDAAIRDAIEPGIDGLGVRFGERELHLTPGDMIAYGLFSLPGAVRRSKTFPPANWLRTRAPEVLTAKAGEVLQVHTLQPFRFRTIHFCEPAPNQPPVELQRGVVLVGPGAVTAESLDRAIARVGKYLHYRQNSNGLFSHEYLPVSDEYVPLGNLFARPDAALRDQAAALWALARYGRWANDPKMLADAAKGIRRLGTITLSYPGRDDLLFLGTRGSLNSLGLTARYTLALVEHPDDKTFGAVRKKYAAAMITLQQDDGVFFDVFPPAERTKGVRPQFFYPGEALLALAHWYEAANDPASPVPTVFRRAFSAYPKIFRAVPVPGFVLWQSQAFAKMARLTNDADYAAYVYEMTDWLATQQLTEADSAWPEMVGGIATAGPGRAAADTAAYLAGFADALALAQHRGDHNRAAAYEKLVRRAARFVLQLTVRPEECYYMRSPEDAVGGVRTALSNARLRIDHVQYALLALIKTREALFGPRLPSQRPKVH